MIAAAQARRANDARPTDADSGGLQSPGEGVRHMFLANVFSEKEIFAPKNEPRTLQFSNDDWHRRAQPRR